MNYTESNTDLEEVTIKELIQKIINWYYYLKGKIIVIIIAGCIGGAFGLFYAWEKKVKYIATLTFVLEEEKGIGSGLTGALGFANSLGVDLGADAGGVFSSSNIIELMKSRTLVTQALLEPINIRGMNISLADYYITISRSKNDKNTNFVFKNNFFTPSAKHDQLTFSQDSLMTIIWKEIVTQGGILSVSQKDKKVGILTIESKSTDEFFSKLFTETIAKVVSDFYIQTKSKRARYNLEMLQKQTDSIKQELNRSISGVAVANDNIYNLNSALNVKRISSTQKQIDVQTNSAILSQLIPNLEMAKLSVRKETPLIQIIDKPVFPLMKEEPNKFKTTIVFAILFSITTSFGLILRKVVKQVLL